MNYASFYGGRKGSSFIIVKNYPDILTMTTDFSQGGVFTEVNYDEYVIINTVNKNHPDNGTIFRRGYDYNSERKIDAYIPNNNGAYTYAQVAAGGAIYIGTIVGPAGRSPHLTLTTYTIAENKQAEQGFDEQKSSGEYNTLNSLVPGKYQENSLEKFNDTIKWFCASIRYPNNDDGTAYIGFEIPYLVIDYETQSVEPYDDGNYADTSQATRIDDTTHPFYEKWLLDIPKGIKGDTLKNFRVIIPTNNDRIYEPESNLEEQYSGKNDDVQNQRKILVYDYYNYDETNNPNKITYYIGDYNEITDFTLDEQGTLTVAFTHQDTITYYQKIKWIQEISLNEDTGHFFIRYNTKHPVYETDPNTGEEIIDPETGQLIPVYETDPDTGEEIIDPETGQLIPVYDYDTIEANLKWVKEIELQENGIVNIHYTLGTETSPNIIKWINDISLATRDIQPESLENQNQESIKEGTFKIKYNTGDQLIEYLKWVNDITLSEKGQLTLHYSGNGEDKIISHENNFIKWINQVKLSNDGKLSIVYNTGTTSINPQTGQEEFIPTEEIINYKNTPQEQIDNRIKWITNLAIENDGSIVVSYNTGQDVTLEDQIKWIQNVSLDPTTGQFTVEYVQNNIPDYTVQLKWPNNVDIMTKNTTGKEGTGTQKVKIDYTDGTSAEIGEPLNYIMQTKITSDKHLIILYADPEKRKQLINQGKAYIFSGSGTVIQPYTDFTEPTSGYYGWLDLGSVYSDSGILIGKNYYYTDIDPSLDQEDTLTQEQIINFLNTQHAGGLSDGKLITVGLPNGEKSFYGFSYDYNGNTYVGWYYLGTFANVSAILASENTVPTNVHQDALWFIIEKIYSITYNLTNVSSSNTSTVINENTPFQTKIQGLNPNNVSITMGGTNITNQVYNSITQQITINQVTGDLVITANGS